MRLFLHLLLRRPDSNRRPLGYEPNELPTAPLRGVRFFFRFRTFCCGGLTRTDDLWVMSPTSYQLLHSAIYTLSQIRCKGTASFLKKQIFYAIFFQCFFINGYGHLCRAFFDMKRYAGIVGLSGSKLHPQAKDACLQAGDMYL